LAGLFAKTGTRRQAELFGALQASQVPVPVPVPVPV
jgi:hypothetical protein